MHTVLENKVSLKLRLTRKLLSGIDRVLIYSKLVIKNLRISYSYNITMKNNKYLLAYFFMISEKHLLKQSLKVIVIKYLGCNA